MTTIASQRGSITDEQLEHWHDHGYVLVEGLLDDDDVGRAREAAASYFPTADEFAATPRRYTHLTRGMNLELFPFGHDGITDVLFHPAVVAVARRLLGTEDVLLSQGSLMAKYGGTADYDQPHHLDYPNNTFAVPDDGEFNMIAGIIYLTDVTEELGPTCVVSTQVTGSEPLWPTRYTREERPEWYEREVAAAVPAGSMLLYSIRTFHRGTAFRAASGGRFTQHVVYQSRENTWSGWRDWAKFGNTPVFRDFVERATVEQRTLFGFPAPGHRYWTPTTVAAMSARYPNMDVEPYAAASGERGAPGER